MKRIGRSFRWLVAWLSMSLCAAACGRLARAETPDFDLHMTRFPPVQDQSSAARQRRPGAAGFPRTEYPEIPARHDYPNTGFPILRRNVPQTAEDLPDRSRTRVQPASIPNHLQPSSSSPDATGSGADARASAAREPIGPKPPEDSNELLARDTSLLLKPGQIETEIAFLYTRQQAPAIVVLPDGSPVLERLRNRAFLVPISVRYGWTKKLELFSVVPLGLSLFERDNVLAEAHEEAGMLADVTAGFVWQVPDSHFFHLLSGAAFTFSVILPTSSSSASTISGNQATLGNGVWKLGMGLNWVESYDPVVFFGGLGYQYQFAENSNGLRIQRGDAFNAYAGLGFAVSDDVSLSAQVSALVQDVTSVNDITIPNSDIEPLSVRLGFVRRLSRKSRIQPSVEFGLTEDAADATISLRFIHSSEK